MIPEIEEAYYHPERAGYIAKCPQCGKLGNFEASPGAAIYLLSIHMEGH